MMARMFTGPVELSEFETPNHEPVFVGDTLRFRFQARKHDANPSKDMFPQVIISTARVNTWKDWQQHEVRLNGYLIGTIRRGESEPQVFTFEFQPRVLRIDATPEYWNVPQDKINFLEIVLGSGGFGLNDSFDVNWVDIKRVELGRP